MPYTLDKVDRATKVTESGLDYFTVNGKGYVPALVLDDGEVLTEGLAISLFIADQAPESGLAPAGGLERYRLLEAMSFISSELHKTMGSMFNPAQTPEWRAAVTALLEKRLDWLAGSLGDREYLCADRFTIADAYLFTVLGWAGRVKFDLSKWPTLQAYIARHAARPAVRKALEEEGLT